MLQLLSHGANLLTLVLPSVSTRRHLVAVQIFQNCVLSYSGPTAFSSWTYILNYSSSNAISSITVSLNTTQTSVHLESLRPATLYQLTITARGPGGDESPVSELNFTTANTPLLLPPFPAQCK